MSRLEELLQEYCPDGVEYKRLGDIATISRGGSFQKKDYVDEGVPCIHYGQIYTQYGLFVHETLTFISEEKAKKQKFAEPNDIVMAVTSENIEDVCKCVAWLGSEKAAVSGHTAIIHHNQDPKYLVYYLRSSMFDADKRKLAHGTKVIEVTPDKLNDIEIPVPPLPVQREIVRILDEYTEKVTELNASLDAELTARKKQYEYYRDELMTAKPGWKKYKLSELGTLTRGKRFVKADAVEVGIPCIHYGELYTHYGIWANKVKSQINPNIGKQLRYAEKNDVVIVGAGENDWDIGVGVAWLGDEKVAVHDACYTLHHQQNPKFISYYLRTTDYHQQIKKHVSTGKICAISAEGVGQSVIYLPNIEEQNYIVSLLDEFDEHINYMSTGLPAEIAARQAQYEYYRDKLLTFKRKEA